MRVKILILCIALAAGAAGQTPNEAFDPSVVRLLPAETSLVLGVQWRQLLNSQSGQLLQKQVTSAQLPIFPSLATFQKALLEDVDALFLSASLRDGSGGKRQPPLLTVVKGRFDRGRLQGWIRGKTENYGKVELLTPAGAKPPTLRICLLDPETLLLGDRSEVTAAINRAATLALRKDRMPLFERAARLSSGHQIWLAVDVPAAGFKNATGPAAPVISELKGLDVGVSFSRGLDLQANLWAKSDPSAGSLVGAVQALLAMATLEQGDTPEVKDLLTKIAVRQESSAVNISLSLTESELDALQQLESRPRKTAPVVAGAAAGTPPRPAAPRNPQPTQPRTIRIIGMEKGSAEVQVGPR